MLLSARAFIYVPERIWSGMAKTRLEVWHWPASKTTSIDRHSLYFRLQSLCVSKEMGRRRQYHRLPDPVQCCKNCQAVGFFFSFVWIKPGNITEISPSKLISHVILIRACVCAGFRAFHQFIPTHSFAVGSCGGERSGRKGLEIGEVIAGKHPFFL